MRMWKVHPSLLCNKHLLGEHVEMHMFAGSIRCGKSVKGYIENDLLEPQNIKKRHDMLAQEMINRGMHHGTPLFITHAGGWPDHHMDEENSVQELRYRCTDCKERIDRAIMQEVICEAH